jgi:tRNA-Thr(GGU) m(6)t(6)A37 methyltransferase TsaA
MLITMSPIGRVHSSRQALDDDGWDAVTATIELAPEFSSEALAGIEDFSHAEILFFFDRAAESSVERGARHPRGNTAWPRVGIFAQRGKDRPNRLGATIVRVLGREGRILRVAGLDAADGTPVVDIKPVMREFLPRGELRQPAWSGELMRGYW